MTLQEIYLVIDDSDFDLTENNENKVISLFKSFIQQKGDENIPVFEKFAQVEIDIQNFIISDNKLGPAYTGTDNDGGYFEYPTLKTWTNDDFEYLYSRQTQTENIFLKAKYSHILWLSPRKHFSFALDALQQYKKIIHLLNNRILKIDDWHDALNLNHNLSNAFYLSVSTGKPEEIQKLKKLLLPIANKFHFGSDKIYINISLVKLMLHNPKTFKQIDFKSLDKKCLKHAEKEKSLYSKIEILKIADNVSSKLGLKNTIYLEMVARCYEELSYQREDGTNIASISFCQSALKYYKKVKNKSKIKEVESRYKHLKQTMHLGEFSQDIDLTEILKESKKIANSVLKESTDYIIQFLMYSPQIFPSYKYLYEKAIAQEKGENSFFFVAPTQIYDQFGHTSAHYNDKEEKVQFAIMLDFSFTLRTSSLILLREIILGAIEINKLSSRTFLNFISKNSWLGQDIIITYKQEEKKSFNWLQTLSPGICDFFGQMFFYYQNPLNQPNYILTIDSLSLKIEGILRDICELRGVTTFFQADDGKGRSIMREKDINVLLREDIIKNTLTDDDLMLLRFLLVDKAGWNLRNKVAHTLIREANGYGLHYVLLLLVVVIKLSKNEYAPLRNI